MNKKYTVGIPEECSIPAIYKAATAAAGINPDAVKNWDCRKILVSPDFFTAYQAYMEQQNQAMSTGVLWLMCGPKVCETLGSGEVEIQDGFFTTKE